VNGFSTGRLDNCGRSPISRTVKKHGSWIRYDRNDMIEYQEEFENNIKIKKK
jgi:hypothetical protein